MRRDFCRPAAGDRSLPVGPAAGDRSALSPTGKNGQFQAFEKDRHRRFEPKKRRTTLRGVISSRPDPAPPLL